MANIIVECKQGSEEWLAARAGAITASRFSTARSRMKVNRGAKKVGDWTGEAESYAQLLAIERIAGKPLDETFQTWAMKRGQELEPIARDLYEDRTGSIIENAGLVLTEDRLFGYSTDGIVFGQPGGIEIKCPAAADKVAGVWLDPAPIIAEYQDQIDGGMWLPRWEWIDLVVYTPWLESVGKDLFIHRIHRNEERIAALETDLVAFSRLVAQYEARLRGTEPPKVYTKQIAQVIGADPAAVKQFTKAIADDYRVAMAPRPIPEF